MLQQPLCAVLLDQLLGICSQEWTFMKELTAAFPQGPTAISVSSHPTLSMLSPLLYKLLTKVLKVEVDGTPSGKALKLI